MNVNSVSGTCQNRRQNFGAVRITKNDATQLLGLGEMGLPRSLQNKVGELFFNRVLPKKACDHIVEPLAGADVIMTEKEADKLAQVIETGEQLPIIHALQALIKRATPTEIGQRLGVNRGQRLIKKLYTVATPQDNASKLKHLTQAEANDLLITQRDGFFRATEEGALLDLEGTDGLHCLET